MPRTLTELDRQLWESFSRQIGPLKGRPPKSLPTAAKVCEPLPPGPAASSIAPKPARAAIATTSILEIGVRAPGLDTTSWRGLSKGTLRPERTLDLHGRTAQTAFSALHAFLLRAQAERLRCVEIITGVGSGTAGGVLRRELPFWLSRSDLRHLVLAAVHPHPANQGSVRVLLRRSPERRS